MSIYKIFGIFELVKFLLMLFGISCRGSFVRRFADKAVIFILVLLFSSIISFGIDLLLYHGLVWIAGQFGIVAKSNLAYAVIVMILNLALSSN